MIEGLVINTVNGRGIPRADVVLRNLRKPGLANAVRADDNGHFLFKSVEPGLYRLSADRPSFFIDPRQKVVQLRFEVAAGDHRKDLLLRLLPAAVVTGQVVDEHSDPMQHVQVKLLARTHRDGRLALDAAGLGLTDDRGMYRIYDVLPGNYYVLAEITPELQEKGMQVVATTGIVGLIQVAGTGEPAPERDIAFSPLFFPGTRDFLEAQALPVGAGQEVQAGFIFTTMPSVSIRGRVTNGITGAPGENPTVSASWSEYVEGSARDVRMSPQDGGFEVRSLAPGLYTLRASFSKDGETFTAQQTVAVGPHGVDNVLLAAFPDSDVTGRVIVENPPPTGNRLTSMGMEFRSQDTTARSTASAQGPTMQFQTRVRPGERYIVSARGLPGDYYLKAVRVSGHDVERNNVMVSERRGAMDLVVSPDGGHIGGFVVDENDQFVSGAVVLVPEESRRGLPDLFRKVRADSKGAFALRGLSPGAYALYAFDDIDLDDVINHPEILNQYATRAKSLVVSEKGAYTIFLQIIRAAGEEP
jgi:protocatechuate 3,4-dioxygenase beta subunit